MVEDWRGVRFCITTLQIYEAEIFLVKNKNCKRLQANVQIKDRMEKKKKG